MGFMKLKDSDINVISELRKKGFKIKDIAEIFGVSPRRIQQILKNPSLKKPGRKRIELSPELRGEIIQLREKGYTINQIHQNLESRRYSISRYKIWKTLKEHQESEMMKTINDFRSLIKDYRSAVHVSVIPLVKEDNSLLRLFVIVDIPKCKVIYCDIVRSLSLKEVINIFDFHVLRVQIPELVILFPTTPLIPTRSSENRLTRHLKNLGISYLWIPKPLRKIYIKEVARIKKLFRSELGCSPKLIKQIEEACGKFYGVYNHGNTEQDKEIFKEQNCRGDKKL